MTKYFCFLHGTTCRRIEYDASVDTLKKMVFTDYTEIPCYWGGVFGANLSVNESYGNPLTEAWRAVTTALSLPTQELVLRFVADVMKYQASSERILGYLEGTLHEKLDQNSQLVIVGHSLGAIIAADLVATTSFIGTVGLITVGNLLGPLYKLECLKYFTPKHSLRCKKWLNVHDPADMLSAEIPEIPGVESRLTKTTVEQEGVGFPQCHSKYFENSKVQREIREFLNDL